MRKIGREADPGRRPERAGVPVAVGVISPPALRPGMAAIAASDLGVRDIWIFKSNPIPLIIPCHRVVGSDGALTGFGGGLPLKELLLSLEGARPGGSRAMRRSR